MDKLYFNLHIARAAACLGVLLVHLSQQIEMNDRLRSIFSIGSSGVSVFFLLSGLLAFASYDRSFKQGKKKVDWIINHILRILAVYYVVIMFYAVLYRITGGIPNDETELGWFRYIFCISQVVPSSDAIWSNMGGTWTVSVSVLFYLIVPILYRIIQKWNHAIVFFILSYLGARVIEQYTEWFRVVTFFYYFALGIIIYNALKEGKEKLTMTVGLLLILSLIIIDSKGGLLFCVVIALLLLQTMNVTCSNKFTVGLVETISKYSYSIYLVHLFVIEVLHVFPIENDYLYIVVFLLSSTVGSFLLYQLVEKNVQRILRAAK